MLIKIAWKNIWRNRVRSGVVIVSIALGLWAGVFASAFVQGMMKSKVDSMIASEVSHVQFHQEGFRDEFKGKLNFEGREVLEKVRSDERVEAATERVISMGMLASSHKNSALKLVGVDPETEMRVSNLYEHIIEGDYFETKKKRPIVISEKTAEDYDIKLNSKVVFTCQDIHGEITRGAFRVVGIYKTSNVMYDKMTAFVPIDQLRKLYDISNETHEVAVWLKDYENAESFAKDYQAKMPNLEVLPWMDLATGMRMMLEAFDTYLYIIVGIILVMLMFSIVNTMLMAVLERVREIGMLMAIGMNKPKVFRMIMFETVFMTMIGVPVGLLLSWLSVNYFGTNGINLSGASYEEMGFASILYPYLDQSSYVGVTIMVLVMAILAAIYPAWKALRLKPVEAIRKV
jgi:ABC-type lipoprotein release transport system permease subunit